MDFGLAVTEGFQRLGGVTGKQCGREAAAPLLFQQAICSPGRGSFPCKEPDIRAPFVAKRSLSRGGGSHVELEELILKRGVPGAPAAPRGHRDHPGGSLPGLAGRSESRAVVRRASSQEETPWRRV